jgi:hypothetical protein
MASKEGMARASAAKWCQVAGKGSGGGGVSASSASTVRVKSATSVS